MKEKVIFVFFRIFYRVYNEEKNNSKNLLIIETNMNNLPVNFPFPQNPGDAVCFQSQCRP